MKRLILIFLLLAFLFASCKQEYNILSYQESNIEADCTINDKYRVMITKNPECLSLRVLEPQSMVGISFELKNESAYAIKDEMKISVSKECLAGICAILNSFSLDEESITTVTQNNVVSYDTDYGLYSVTYGENNLPYHFSIISDTYEYEITVNSLKIQ